MVAATDAQRLVEIQRIQRERPGEKLIFVQPSKKPRVTGINVINPKTGQVGQSRFPDEFAKGSKLVTIESPQILASRRRSEEKGEERELAQKEAEFEAKRIREGRIKLKDVVLTRKGAAKILRKKLAEAPPTKQELARERKQRIAQTVAKQVGFRTARTLSERIEEKRLEGEIKSALVEEEQRVPTPRVQVDVSKFIQPEPTVPELAEVQAAKPIQQTIPKREDIDISKFITKPPVSEVRAAPKPEGFFAEGFDILARRRFELSRERAKGRITLRGEVKGVALGLGTSVLFTAAGAKELAVRPVETVVAAGVAAKLIGGRIVSGEGFPEIGQIIRQEPGFAVGFIGGEIAQARAGGELIAATSSRTRRLLARVSPKFKPVKTEALGVQKIKGVKIAGEKADIGLIPGGKGLKIDVGDDLLKQVDIPLAKRPKIPRVSPEQRKILGVIKEQKDIAGGSFAQRTLLKKEFTRPFADIDIAAKSPKATAALIESRLKGKVKIEKLKITDSPVGDFDVFRVVEKKSGKVIADVDPLKFVEEGLATRFRTTTVGGVEFINPQARLLAKAQQLARGKTKGGKVAKDITALTGGKVKLDTPLTQGAFKFTETEKSLLLGKKGPVTTSARDFFKILKGDEVIISKEGLFATPFNPKTLEAQTRITRLGLEQRRATLIDILTGDFTFKRQKPQIIVFPEQKIGKVFKITPGTELEVLAKGGTIVRKQGKLGTTIINKKVIPIFEADVGRASKALERLTKQAKTGKISKAGRKELGRLLVKETGFDVSRAVVTKPLVDITDILTDVFGGVTRGVRTRGRGIPSGKVSPPRKVSRLFRGPLRLRVALPPSAKISVPPSRQPSIKLSFPPSARVSLPPFGPPSRPPSVPPSVPPSGIVSVPPSIPPSIPPIVPPITSPPEKPPPTVILPPIKIKPKERRKGYNVFVKSEGKFKKVNKVPLTKSSALGRGAFLTDNSTAAQFKIRKAKSDKTPRVGSNEGYFDLNRFKFRAFRARLKRKKGIIGPLPQNQFIERRTNRIDTIGEIQGLSLAKLLARSRPSRLKLEV